MCKKSILAGGVRNGGWTTARINGVQSRSAKRASLIRLDLCDMNQPTGIQTNGQIQKGVDYPNSAFRPHVEEASIKECSVSEYETIAITKDNLHR